MLSFGVTGDSMRCKGAVQVPLTLSIDGFTARTDARANYGAFTVQSGFTGRDGQESGSQELLGINTLRTNLTINFEGFHFPDAGPKAPIIGMDYFARQSESSQYSIPK